MKASHCLGTAIALPIVALIVGVVKDHRQPGRQPLKMNAAQPFIKQYVLDVRDPARFVHEHLPEVFGKPKVSLFGDDAIDGIANVSILGAGENVDLQVELISGEQLDVDKFSIELYGTPSSLQEAYAVARRICDVIGIPDDRIVGWYEAKKYEDPQRRPSPLQIGKTRGCKHEIEIRSSLEIEGNKPWRVLYSIYFSLDKGGAD